MNISDLMSSDHCRIEKHLEEFRGSVGAPDQKKKFTDFRWELEKHLFMEEKAIFTFARNEDKEDFEAIPKLEREHDEIIDLLKKIETVMKEGKKQEAREEVDKLCNLLIKHKEFEDSKIYPKLDVELNDEQKNIITKRIMEFSPE